MASSVITDIHVHILPGIDDGPEEFDQAISMLSACLDAGIHRVFCTPHYCSPHFDVSFTDIERTYEQFREGITGVPVELALGAEVRLSRNFEENLREGRIPTLGTTRYILVEFSSTELSRTSLTFIHELLVRGYQPIMAHPERNILVQTNPTLVDELVEEGILLQLTAQSLSSPRNISHMANKIAWRLLENGQAAVIASDAHNTDTRPPRLLDAYDTIAVRLGQRVVDRLMENANAIWEDQSCREIQAKSTKRGLFRSLFKV